MNLERWVRGWSMSVLVFCVGAGAAFAKPAMSFRPAKPFNKLSMKMQNQLKSGKVPVRVYYKTLASKRKVTIAKAWILIRKPIKPVFQELMKFGKRYQYMPRLTSSKVVKKFSKNEYHVRQTLKVLWSKIRVNVRIRVYPMRKMTWHLIKSMKNDIKDNIGAWEFEELPGGNTLITYTLYTDTGRPIPGFIKNRLIKGDLPNVLGNVRKRVMSGGKWRK